MATYKLPDLLTGQSSSSAILLFGGGKVPTNELNVIAVGWQDYNTGNWWVTYNDELPLGYFPKELLPKMEDNALLVQMGGEVVSPLNVPSPPMGSGHPSNEGPSKAAYFIEVQFVDEHNNLFDPYPADLHSHADISDYYSVADDHYANDKDKYVFAYGGAGGFK
ncbi:hypothetical protein ZIOFF_072472 [Zingiber officinale]|uniref:Neprosin PEP catalytic domain-containing protein n=1 Tax=Zingiber officinale TaxID=94328 RepID=A0A8J5ETB5_ZINOF|nr:hypothetical protein ZIOFF_072472 [Zingiber officinale]